MLGDYFNIVRDSKMQWNSTARSSLISQPIHSNKCLTICLFSDCLVRFLFWSHIDGSGCRTWYRAHLCLVCCCCSAFQVNKQTDKKLVSQSNKAKELTIYQFRQNARNLSLSSVSLPVSPLVSPSCAWIILTVSFVRPSP